MRIFKTKVFSRWAKKEKVSDVTLRRAVDEMESGLYDASLGNGVYKKRLAIQGRGKSGGARTILAYRSSRRAFFVFGFLKSERANINQIELRRLKEVAQELLSAKDSKLKDALAAGELEEIENG